MPYKDLEKRRACARASYHKRHVPGKLPAAKLRNQEYVKAYLLGHPCVDCGEKDIIVLDFDHRDRANKVFAIGRMIGGRLDRLIQEIEKCDVRCANCHRRRTAKQFGWWRS
jgi:hypothetical protein